MGRQSVLILFQNRTPSPEHGCEFQRQHVVLMVVVSHQKFVREIILDLIQFLPSLRASIILVTWSILVHLLLITTIVLSYSVLLLGHYD